MLIAIALGLTLLCLAIFGAAAFFLAKGMASVFGALARQWLGYPPPAIALRVVAWVCALLVLILLPMRACSRWQVELYRQAIPPQFELTEVVHHDEVSGFREGCGFAVFRLSEENLARIRSRGLAYFETAHLGRDGDPYHQYQPWKATPTAEHDHLFRGQDCAGSPPELLNQAQRAISKEGAFFTTGHEQDLVVVPALGVLIYSYDG
ncbi:hypothetical protein [Acidovorax sp.]|uniref:hypothetical protein n=1 Tax=Acidovorax sp. TaxID=1872122 RepID=UPI002635ACD5|nr:hypothetical protein [Acidovorax sp.]